MSIETEDLGKEELEHMLDLMGVIDLVVESGDVVTLTCELPIDDVDGQNPITYDKGDTFRVYNVTDHWKDGEIWRVITPEDVVHSIPKNNWHHFNKNT
jgi:hypothetical protein